MFKNWNLKKAGQKAKTATTTTARVTGLGLSAAALIAMPVIMKWEGVRYKPYYDVGGILTVCYGHTGSDIIKDKVYTKDECKSLLVKDIKDHEAGMKKYLTVNLPPETEAAFLSFTFNTGVGNFSKSTLLRKANAGDLAGACAQLSRWVFVKRTIVQGLVNRRVSERGLCEMGLKTQGV